MSPIDAAIIAGIALGVLVVLVLVVSWVLARLWCKPRRHPSSKTPGDYGLPFEPVSYSSHGVPISGWFVPARSGSSPFPAAILTHGWSTTSRDVLPLARPLSEAGFAVLLYDTRGHGASGEDGPITVRKFAEDIGASFDYLQSRPDVDTARVGIVGRSIGGAAAILAAADDPRIGAVVSCSAFADPHTLTSDYLRMLHVPSWPFCWLVSRFIERWLGTAMRNVTPLHRIGYIAAPVLLIHGEGDRYMLPSNMDLLYSQARQEHTERLLIPGRGHADVLRDPACSREIVAFLSRTLSPGRVRVTG